MTIEEIFSKATANDVISELKSRRFIPQPDTEQAEKALNPKLHDINNPILRPDKRVKVDADNDADSAQKVITTDGEAVNFKTEKVARVALAIQNLIINRAVSFCFGNPPAYNATPVTDKEKMVVSALNKVLYDVKSNSLNRKIGRSIFGFKECAELWYTVDKPNKRYGFDSKFKLRCTLLSPAFGDTLYPYFDETGDMTAFSRDFSRKDDTGNGVNYFETYTATEHWLWKNGANGYEVVEGYPREIAIGKIPVVYGHQRKFETEDVDKLIDRLETLLSNFADTNDYHASPKIFVTGDIRGWAKKGESGSVIEGEDGATMQYVSWQSAPEAVKLEIETLLKMIYTITQTPDISFEAVKGLGAISGVALKLLFMDAHLKVQDKREIFDDYLQRRVNVILAFISKMNTSLESECETIEIEPEIVPYMLTNELDELNYWLTANGNKPVISQEESIEKAGISKDVTLTMQKIKEQTASENSFIIGEPQIEGDA
ncbi:MAG: phage portal protein [Alphaproteobacteria bacterium]|nr:phage portal protein [Alphaproteobacteria bacterium]